MTTVSTRVYRTFSMDFSFEIQHAQRDDGRWFSRCQEKSAYGYTWSAWRSSVEPDMSSAMRVDVSVRLPVDGAAPRKKPGARCRVVGCRRGATRRLIVSIAGTEMDRRACCASDECLARMRQIAGNADVTIAAL